MTNDNDHSLFDHSHGAVTTLFRRNDLFARSQKPFKNLETNGEAAAKGA